MTRAISIITITKNDFNGLKETAKSINEQNNKNYQWIIIDGDSNDGTKQYLESLNADIKISEPDTGIYNAMNKGIRLANGEYFIFMNAGDVFFNKNTLQEIENKLEQIDYKPDLIYGDSKEKHLNGNISDKKSRSHNFINIGMFTHHQSILYKNEKIKSLKYNEKYKIAADYDLTLRLLQNLNNKTLYISIPISTFKKGGISQQQANLGRYEQFISRKNNQSCNIITNSLIYTAQLIRWHLKKINFI